MSSCSGAVSSCAGVVTSCVDVVASRPGVIAIVINNIVLNNLKIFKLM